MAEITIIPSDDEIEYTPDPPNDFEKLFAGEAKLIFLDGTEVTSDELKNRIQKTIDGNT